MPFGETVLFKVPKTGEAFGSFEDRWESGVWLGCAIRDGMTLVGTATGVYKVGTIKRKPDGEQWSKENVKNIVGTPQQPQPGVETRRVTTFAKKKLDETQREPVQFQPPTDKAPEPRSVRILKTDVDKHGPTPNCAGCRAVVASKPWRTAHSAACRQRMEVLMAEDETSKHRVELAAEKINHHIVDRSEIAEEESEKKRQKVSSPPKPKSPKSPSIRQSPGGDPGSVAKESDADAHGSGDADESMSHSRRRADDPLTLRLKAAAAKSASSQKRRATDDADDPRLDHGEVEMSYDDMGSSKKRPAEEAADDSHRNEEPSSGNDDAKSSGDVAMDSIATSECSHCQRTFNSRNLLFKHLYQNHDADSLGDRLKSKRDNSDRRNHPTEHEGSVGDGRTCTDEIARPALYEDLARRHRAISKPR